MKSEGNKLDQRDVEECREALQDAAMGRMVPVFPELQDNHATQSTVQDDERAAGEMYVWFADPKPVYGGDGERFIRAWTAEASKVAALQNAIGKAPTIYRAASPQTTDHRCYAPGCHQWDGTDSCTCQKATATQPVQTPQSKASDELDTLVAVLNAIGYTEEFAAAHPDLKVSEGVKLFLAAREAAQPAPMEHALTYPPEFTDDLQWILGLICFQCIQYAQTLRRAGRNIPSKAEAEQAATIDWMLRHYLADPENWRKTAVAEMRAMADAAQPASGGDLG